MKAVIPALLNIPIVSVKIFLPGLKKQDPEKSGNFLQVRSKLWDISGDYTAF